MQPGRSYVDPSQLASLVAKKHLCATLFRLLQAFVFTLIGTLAAGPVQDAKADSALDFKLGTSHVRTALADSPGLVLGGSLRLPGWEPLGRVSLVPQFEFLFARRHLALGAADIGIDSYTIDALEFPLFLRTELSIADRIVYALGGVYGSVMIRGQQTSDGTVIAAYTLGERALSQHVDFGLLAGLGIDLFNLGAGTFSAELRYQRRVYAIDNHSNPHEMFSLLLAYGRRKDTWASDEDSGSLLRGRSQPITLKAGVVASRLQPQNTAAVALSDSYRPGLWFGGVVSPLRMGSWLALLPQFEVALAQRSISAATSAEEVLGLDYLDTAVLLRAELATSSLSLYGLGGFYGSALIRAQQSHERVITDMRAAVNRIDAGWVAGGGIEVAAFASTRLSLELRYQHGLRDLLAEAASGVTQQSITGLFGISYGPKSATRKARRITAVAIGRPGDRWLSTIDFIRIERATRADERGYEVTYHIAGHGTMVLFWSRDDIDFEDRGQGFRHKKRPFKHGRLVYPTRITRESLPRVHPHIVTIEEAYSKQAKGAIAAMEGFAVIAAIGDVKPVLRAIRPRGPPTASAGAGATRRASTAKAAQITVEPSAKALAKALEAAGHVRPPGAAAHHIVAGRARWAQPARDVLKKYGIGINDAVNGVFLPRHLTSPNPAGAAVHSTLHTKKYYDDVNRLLSNVKNLTDVESVLHRIGQTLLSGGL